MRVLQLCHKPPRPALDGGCIAMDNVTTGLMGLGVSVKLLSINTDKHPYQKSSIDPTYMAATGFETIYVDTSLNRIDAFSSLITSDSYHINRFFSPDFDKRLKELLESDTFDIIHLESLYMTPYLGTIRHYSSAPVVLRAHNVEYQLWKRISDNEPRGPKKAYLSYAWRKLKAYEHQTIQDVDGLVAISEVDAQQHQAMGYNKPLIIIPFSIDPRNYPFNGVIPEPLSVFHLGAMDWHPNVEGVAWLLREVWPLVRKNNPQITLYLAGRAMQTKSFEPVPEGVILVGEVENALSFMQSKQIMCVPLRAGGGMRIKLIEAMAMGKAIISTSLGAEGIGVIPGKEMLIADDAGAFAQAIVHLANNPEQGSAMGKLARAKIEAEYVRDPYSQRLIEFYRSLIHS